MEGVKLSRQRHGKKERRRKVRPIWKKKRNKKKELAE